MTQNTVLTKVDNLYWCFYSKIEVPAFNNLYLQLKLKMQFNKLK